MSIGRAEEWLILISFSKLHLIFVAFMKSSVNRTITTSYGNAMVWFIFIFVLFLLASFPFLNYYPA